MSPLETEAWCPPALELVPRVMVIPEDFKYSINGKLDSWESYGNWQYNVNRDLDILPDYEKRKVDELTKGLEDPRQIIKTLYYYLQDNTRYINVSIDVGGLRPLG